MIATATQAHTLADVGLTSARERVLWPVWRPGGGFTIAMPGVAQIPPKTESRKLP